MPSFGNSQTCSLGAVVSEMWVTPAFPLLFVSMHIVGDFSSLKSKTIYSPTKTGFIYRGISDYFPLFGVEHGPGCLLMCSLHTYVQALVC